jgi:hypothetical protein
MKKWTLLAGILAFLASFIAIAPAADVYGWLRGTMPARVQLYGVDGTIFDGHADVARLGDIRVRDLGWHMHPLSLLTGHVDMHVDGRTAGGRSAASVHLGFGGSLELKQVTTTATLSGLKPFLNTDFLPAKGQIGARFKQLKIENGRLVGATGQASLGQLAYTLPHPQVPLGDYKAAVNTGKQGITAVLSDADAPVELAGRWLLTPKGAWSAQVRLRARPKADPEIKNLLKTLGRPDSQGWYRINQSGHL